MDVLTREQRSKNMRAIKDKDTKIERILGKTLWARGLRYRKNDKSVFGKPDFTFKKYKVAVFCDSEFFHGKDWEVARHRIKTNRDFWYEKIEGNIRRDREVNQKLEEDGWIVLRFWGNDIKQNPEACADKVEEAVMKRRQRTVKYSEIRRMLKLDERKTAWTDELAALTHRLQDEGRFKEALFQLRIEEPLSGVAAEPPPLVYQARLPIEWDVPFPPVENPDFTFIDLFAGIGGFRIAFQKLGGKCVFSSEWDKFSKKTYEANFGEIPFGDITKIDEKSIPDHDVLLAGFPCQPFSIAGVSKKNSLGRAHGFKDEAQGTLFFDILRIVEAKRPKAFLLENVKNLVSHDKGRTFKVIKGALEEAGYSLHYKVLDGSYFVPQHRERIFIAGFDKKVFKGRERFKFPDLKEAKHRIGDILDENVDEKYTLSDKLWNYLQEYARKHKAKGNGFGFGLTDLSGISRTMSARYYKDGAEILIPQEGKNPRRLTPRECARLQGYPEEFIIPVSDNQAYRQFGNSVVVPLIHAIGKELVLSLKNEL